MSEREPATPDPQQPEATRANKPRFCDCTNGCKSYGPRDRMICRYRNGKVRRPEEIVPPGHPLHVPSPEPEGTEARVESEQRVIDASVALDQVARAEGSEIYVDTVLAEASEMGRDLLTRASQPTTEPSARGDDLAQAVRDYIATWQPPHASQMEEALLAYQRAPEPTTRESESRVDTEPLLFAVEDVLSAFGLQNYPNQELSEAIGELRTAFEDSPWPRADASPESESRVSEELRERAREIADLIDRDSLYHPARKEVSDLLRTFLAALEPAPPEPERGGR